MADSLTTGPQRQFSPGQLPGGKRPVKMPNYFVLTKSVIPGAEKGPAATQDHSQAPRQLHHPPCQGDMLGVQHADPFWLLAGLGDRWGARLSPVPVPPSLGLTVTLSPPGSPRAKAQTLPPLEPIPPSHPALLVGRLLGAVL